jgi:TMEM175 potassium channel family protein
MREDQPNARLEAFSDGVIAVAITLLVLDIRLPEGFGKFSDAELWNALLELKPRFMAFLISFAVVGIYWINHHAKFRHIKSTRPLLFINPLPVVRVHRAVHHDAHRRNPNAVGTTVYALGMVACGLLLTLLWVYADRAGLVEPDLPRQERQRLLLTTLLSSVVFAVSVPLAFANPDWAKYFWLLLVPAQFLLRGLAVVWWRARHPGAPLPNARHGEADDDH